MLDILPTAKAGEKKNRDHEHVATVLKLPAKGGDRQDRMYKRADKMANTKNHTQKGRFSVRRERERGSRTRQTHFRLYNSYSMQFAQTRKQKSKKKSPCTE